MELLINTERNFDKKGKIAFKFENELWRADDLVEIFSKLNAE
jgi:hypothetical protein